MLQKVFGCSVSSFAAEPRLKRSLSEAGMALGKVARSLLGADLFNSIGQRAVDCSPQSLCKL
jgi:hypothetical protein